MLHRTVVALAAILLMTWPALAEDAAPAPVCIKNGAPVSQADQQAARDILIATKATDRVMMVIDAMMPTMLDLVQKASPGLTDEAVAAYKAALRDEFIKSIPELVDVEACIYTQHFTADELNQLSLFYKSPLGQKLLAENNPIVQESMAVGRAWGERAGRAAVEHVIAKFKKDGGKT